MTGIKFGTTNISPLSTNPDNYTTDFLPITGQNGELIYCPDGNGMSIPNNTTVTGSYGYKKNGEWVKTDNTNLIANAASLWRKGYSFAKFDPTEAGNGPFNPTIISDTTAGGVRRRQIYIDITFAGETFQVYVVYRVPTSTPPVGGFPCLFTASGWQQGPQEFPAYNTAGWATLGFDFAGQKDEGPPYTNYPSSLAYGRHLTSQGGYTINTTLSGGAQITDPRQTSEYLWAAVMRRAFEYLLIQPEINVNQIGMRGHSYGGTMAWNMVMDNRMKAIVSYFGNGWTTYYRDKLLWKYQIPATAYPAFTSGEKIYLNAPTVEMEAKYACVPILLINGSNDHHGGHDRVDDTFSKMPSGIPWDFSHDANKGHNVSLNVSNEQLWLNKHVLSAAITWPNRPTAWFTKSSGIPQFNVKPDTVSVGVSAVQFWTCQVEPFNVSRTWVQVPTVSATDLNGVTTWTGTMTAADYSKYLFGYANVIYTNNVVTSTNFNAIIPNNI